MIKILVAEQSYVIRKGLIFILNNINVPITIIEANDNKGLLNSLKENDPQLLLVNITLSNNQDIRSVIDEIEDMRVVYIYNVPLIDVELSNSISVFDSQSKLYNNLKNILSEIETNDNLTDSQLSEREKEVLKGIAMGKTNKEIAAELFISTHTVITHRKNLTKKLNIKTVSGLTVYAMINQFISVEDIN